MTGTQNSTDTSTDSADSVILVVDPDDIISAMRRNARDAHTRRTHKLRFNRPLEGRVTASTHVHQEGTYWPNPKTAPLTLNPEQFIEDDAAEETAHPEQWQVHEAAKDTDGVDDLDDVSDETLDECWEVHREIWESTVRNHLKTKVDIHESKHEPSVEPHIVTVEYDDE
jgi:hypothetical protein